MTLRRLLRAHRLVEVDAASPLMAMVDVVFLLMIFFLFGSARFSELQLVAALAAKGPAVSSRPGETAWLTLRTQGTGEVQYRVNGGDWLFDRASVHLALSVALGRSTSNGSVTVDALPGVAFQALIDALGLSERCGAVSVSLRAEKPP